MEQDPLTENVLDEVKPRRHHTKSRNGCGICKRRKIKCDEKRPVCANCVRHGTACDIGPADVGIIPSSKETTPVRQTHSTVLSANDRYRSPGNHQVSDGATGTPVERSATQQTGLELTYLELLHNYTTLTSHTLSGDPVLRNVWRINVPKVGFSYDYVLRSVFAFSALHMALFSSKKRQFYLDIASSEHGIALSKIASALSHITRENCSAVYIAAVLAFFYAWAYPRQTGDIFLVSDSGTAEWVFLLKGVRTITESWTEELRNGPFSSMFRLGHSRIEQLGGNFRTSAAWLSSTEHTQLVSLRRMVAQAGADDHMSEVYEENIENLEICFYAVFSSSHGPTRSQGNTPSTPYAVLDGSQMPVALTSNVYSWLYKMSEPFIELLKQHDRPALVIFAHFSVLIKHLGSCWWMQGWSTHLLQEIWNLLDEEYRLWIRWPIEETGWMPTD